MKDLTKKPDWLRVSYNMSEVRSVYDLADRLELNTVCRESGCPNIGKCSKCGSATFMILGKRCTRNCRFCEVDPGVPAPPDPDEPRRLSEAVKTLGLSHAVVTSVTRDDLQGGGASVFADCVRAIKETTGATVEVLIPDLKGDEKALDTVIAANPEVIGHNVETVRRLYPAARPQAVYERSLAVLKYLKEHSRGSFVKTAFMVGLGETEEEVKELIRDVRATGCDLLTLGQYLAPTAEHLPVAEYVTPEKFEEYKDCALSLGFLSVTAHPLARSSYMAGDMLREAVQKRNETL
ncbi:MAG: lipoyl synthase [Clostridia bacterium]|nr:lipoyl synthase [Clostridia bacterium]